MAGDDRYVADYLYRESLERLPEGTQRVPAAHRGAGPALGPALRCGARGHDGATRQLRELEAANLFLVPLDRRREWYRYHALFREFLLGELRRAEPDLIAKLHLRAADWYEANGSPALALEHLLDTTERDRCTALMSALAVPDLLEPVRSRPSSGGSRPSATPASRAYPPLAVQRRLDSGADRPHQRSAALGRRRRGGLVRRGAGGRHGVVRLGPGDVAGGRVCGRRRAGCWPTRCSRSTRSRSGAPGETPRSRSPATAHLLVGDTDESRAAFAEASRLAADQQQQRRRSTISESELALLAMDDGQWAGGRRAPRSWRSPRSTSIGCTTTRWP